MSTRIALGAVICLVLSLIVLMTLSDWTVTPGVSKAVLEQAPMLVTRGVRGTSFDAAGNIRYGISAESAAEYDHARELKLVGPHVEIHRGGGERWVVDARQGEVQQGERSGINTIVLKQQVHARLEGGREITLQSDELRYQPALEALESPGAITIREQQNMTQAGQMRADLKTGLLELGQGVRSRYVAPAS